ncbi:hypothetical protein H5410_009613 [Solanum commersonii]|uniref:Uncharacterized protein n=1 Tax=Solanum commersonii TaxID=4109 RepID=A0A9J6AJ93_SOLCO|nr:hypothetical protein H5410_009613 [Solanum commersonii]
MADLRCLIFTDIFKYCSESLTAILCLKVNKASHYDQGCWVIKLVNLRDKSRPLYLVHFRNLFLLKLLVGEVHLMR